MPSGVSSSAAGLTTEATGRASSANGQSKHNNDRDVLERGGEIGEGAEGTLTGLSKIRTFLGRRQCFWRFELHAARYV